MKKLIISITAVASSAIGLIGPATSVEILLERIG
jgi:hypothetical protein